MPRGGPRRGKAGAAYSNRTDLTAKPRLPVTTVPGQPYGQAGAQAAAQQAVPMGTPPLPQAEPEPEYTSPEDVLGLHHPTQRPDEPLTHGLPVGAGGGPEVLPPNALGVGAAYSNARQLITSLAANSDSPTLNTLKAYIDGGL